MCFWSGLNEFVSKSAMIPVGCATCVNCNLQRIEFQLTYSKCVHAAGLDWHRQWISPVVACVGDDSILGGALTGQHIEHDQHK